MTGRPPRGRGGSGPRSAPPSFSSPGAVAARGDASARPDTTTLANGVEVLTEHIPGVRSVSAGVWVRRGSAHEAHGAMGSSHLLEHMVFKGTALRTPREIALALESLGGSLDAYTSREHTSFQARVLDAHLPVAMDVLADLVLSPRLREADLELERQVVLEEIAAVDDTPDDLVFELHGDRLWDGHPYGHRILGSRDTVGAATAEGLRALHRDAYTGRNLVVAAAGNVRHGDFLELAERLFGGVAPGAAPEKVGAPGAGGRGDVAIERDSAQTHVVFGTELVPHADRRRFPLILLSQALGGGMSSRLFQRVREELALAYTVFSFQSFYDRSGMGGVYVGTRPGSGERAVEAIREEFARLAADGLGEEELEQTRQQVKGQVMLSLESTGARLYRLASFALYDEPWLGLDELLARVDGVTAADATAAAAEFFDPERQLVLRLGPEA